MANCNTAIAICKPGSALILQDRETRGSATWIEVDPLNRMAVTKVGNEPLDQSMRYHRERSMGDIVDLHPARNGSGQEIGRAHV